ncbi:MAG: tetratricopeptide repeat protein [Methanosarcina mazei]|nr:tetratricopeptide repeat protein [Methanosarcina mazei]
MTGKEDEYEFEKTEKSSSLDEESTGSEVNEQKESYLDIINIIGSLMQDENYSLKNESILTINKILSFLNKEIYENKNFTEAWLIKGTVLYKTGKYNGAIDAFDGADKALQRNPNIFEAWFNKGSILFELGKYKQALSAVENALRINAEDINALTLKTSILSGLKQDEK